VCGARRQREWEGGQTLFPGFPTDTLTQAYFMGGKMSEELKKLNIMVCQGPVEEKDSGEIRYGDDTVAEVYEKDGETAFSSSSTG